MINYYLPDFIENELNNKEQLIPNPMKSQVN